MYYLFILFTPYRYANNVGKQMNDYLKVVDEMVDEAFASQILLLSCRQNTSHGEDQNTRELAWRETDDEMIRELESPD
jgi:hypothetical protein